MEVRAFKPFKTFDFLTGLSLINKRVKLLLLPPMRVRALLKPFAPLLIAGDKSPTLPVFTKLSLILEQIRFSSEVLEVVCVNALSFIMVMIERAPFSLKVKDKEVVVLVLREQMVNKTNFDIFNGVSKGAVFSIVAGLSFVWIKMTEFRLILIFVIESLNSIVSTLAFLFFRTFFSLCELAKFWSVKVIISSFILDCVVIVATFVIMRLILTWTLNAFKIAQI